MGYCMSQQDADFRMEAKDFPAALKAIQALHGAETIADYGGRHFSWVSYKFYEIDCLIKMMDEWRWNLEMKDGNVVGINFHGEKLGDDYVLFQAIAPWVKAGSFIQMVGEDGSIWRWSFDGTKCVEQAATIKFE